MLLGGNPFRVIRRGPLNYSLLKYFLNNFFSSHTSHMTDLEFIVQPKLWVPLFSTRATSNFGFADLYPQDPGLQLEWYPESSVSVYHLQSCFVLFFAAM